MTDIYNSEEFATLIELAYREDAPTGDLSTRYILSESDRAIATLIAKDDGIISGLEVAYMVLCRCTPEEEITFTSEYEDGDEVRKGDILASIEAPYADLLRAERIMLNFMQRMSGIATYTHQCVQCVAGTKTQILDTRKTAPGHRLTDKMAVRDGGGTNHRASLSDMVMLKDNHIAMAGGILPAVEEVRPHLPISIQIEVETTTLEEVQEAIDAGADIIMLDNMDIETMRRAVELIDGQAKVEASGNMTAERLAAVAAVGVDYISIGALTHSVRAFDISMKIKPIQ